MFQPLLKLAVTFKTPPVTVAEQAKEAVIAAILFLITVLLPALHHRHSLSPQLLPGASSDLAGWERSWKWDVEVSGPMQEPKNGREGQNLGARLAWAGPKIITNLY